MDDFGVTSEAGSFGSRALSEVRLLRRRPPPAGYEDCGWMFHFVGRIWISRKHVCR